jgi:hypothetical protein
MAHHNAVNLSASHLKTIALLPFLQILLTFSRFSANKMASCFSASSGDLACRYVKGDKNGKLGRRDNQYDDDGLQRITDQRG